MEDTIMKNLFDKYVFPHISTMGLIVLVAIVAMASLTAAGVLHPAIAGLPFLLPFIGAVKVRDSLDLIRTIKHTHSAATVTDTVYLLNGRVMMAMNSAALSVANIFLYTGLIEYASETGVAWTAGDKLYWDDTGKKFTKTSTSNTLCGIAAEDKASAAATGLILLDQAS
jgi:predicted RecA/RadA family phage recombinase